MKKDLIRVSTLDMTRAQWIDYRHSGIGASEVGTLMGLNPYKASIELFYDKLKPPTEIESNEAMFMGLQLESLVADIWQYWDGTAQSMIANHKAEKIIRRCRKVNAYLRDPEFFELFVSLDRLINKGDDDEETLLEIKTIAGFAAKQWESGIPPSHVAQLQAQMIVTGLAKGEIAMLKDGRYMEVIPFESVDAIQQSIKIRVRDFWNRIVAARKIIIEQTDKVYLLNLDDTKLMQKISAFEPPPDESESYKEFLQTRYLVKPIARIGRTEDYRDALQILENNELIDKVTSENNLLSSRIKSFIGEAEELNFGSGGRITWREDKKKVRRFILSGVKPVDICADELNQQLSEQADEK